MSTLHNITSDMPIIDLDMDAVYDTARLSRTYLLEFNEAGAVFKWSGKATSRAAAEFKARAELADQLADFNRYKARLVSCLEAS